LTGYPQGILSTLDRRLLHPVVRTDAVEEQVHRAQASDAINQFHSTQRLVAEVSLEIRKEFVRAFVGGVSVVPDEARLELRMRTLPTVGARQPANSTCGLVAGARFVPLQIEMKPLNRYLAGLQRAA
jgi:hypothetical protein